MTTDEMDLRDTARSLTWLYRLLDEKKYAAPPPREARIMRSTPGPQPPAPVPLLDAEDRLLGERREDDDNGHPLPPNQVIPGGLRIMVIDAAQHISKTIERIALPGETKKDAGERQARGHELSAFVAQEAHPISIHHPAAPELLDLMKEQARWLTIRLDQGADINDPFLTMRSLMRTLEKRGLHCPEGTVRYWASTGSITTSWTERRRRTYSLIDVIQQLSKQSPTL